MLSLQRRALRLVLCLCSMMGLFYGFALRAANKWTRWTLRLPLSSGLSHYSTWCLETLHHIPFHSTLTQYPARPRSIFVCVADDGQTRFFSVVVVVLVLSGVSEWGWEATAPQAKSWMIVWIIPTRKKKKTCTLDIYVWSSWEVVLHRFVNLTFSINTCCECFETNNSLKQIVSGFWFFFVLCRQWTHPEEKES